MPHQANRDVAAAAVLPRLVGVLGVVVSVVVAAALPLAYYAVSYASLLSANQIKIEIKAELVNQQISTSPDLWRFQEHRFRELLVRFPLSLDNDRGRILDADGEIVADTATPVAWPVLKLTAPLFDAGAVVGYIELQYSLRGLLSNTALAGALGLLLGGAVFGMISTLRRREHQLAEERYQEQQRARVTLHSIGDAVITIDSNGLIDYINPVGEALTGWTENEAVGQPLNKVMHLIDEATLEPAMNPMVQALQNNQTCKLGHVALIRRDGSTIAIDDSAAPIHDRQGGVIGGVLVFRDVTVTRSMSQRITWEATHDALTGLVNRREFECRVDAALASARSSDQHHVLLYMDLDQFKVVNDTVGHAAGDGLLKQIALLLQDHLRASDTLGRLGGDEFGVLLDACPLDRAELIAADLLAAVKNFRFSWEGKIFVVGISIGVVAIDSDSSSTEIFSAADASCYAAKERGRNRVFVFHRADIDIAEQRKDMDWAGRLGRALAENRFVLYYQSCRALAVGDPGAKHIEILLRLIEEDGSLILPGSFISAAERYNVMPEIDHWVIRTVFSRYKSLVAQLGAPLVCAINLSGTSLNSEGLLEFIREQARLNDLPRGAVCFEITETAAINNLRRATQFIRDVKELGFYFALDDFGGASSFFGYLKNLPVDYLKIDGGFVQDIANDPVDRAMVETINRIGHIMGLKTIAEFAETEGVVEQLRLIGVDFAQGYGVQKPQPLPAALSVAGAAAKVV